MELVLYLASSAGAFWTLAGLLKDKRLAVVVGLCGSTSAVCTLGMTLMALPSLQGILVVGGLWALFGLAYKRTEANID